MPFSRRKIDSLNPPFGAVTSFSAPGTSPLIVTWPPPASGLIGCVCVNLVAPAGGPGGGGPPPGAGGGGLFRDGYGWARSAGHARRPRHGARGHGLPRRR